MKSLPLLLLVALFLYGCAREVTCTDTNIEIGFVGFAKSDFDTVVLRKYQPDDNYQHLIDSTVFFNDSSTIFQSNDTIRVSVGYQPDGIKAGNDWQIYLPRKNRIISISSIKSEQESIKCHFTFTKSQCYCINKIYSVKLDNTPVDLSNINTNLQPYYLYIH